MMETVSWRFVSFDFHCAQLSGLKIINYNCIVYYSVWMFHISSARVYVWHFSFNVYKSDALYRECYVFVHYCETLFNYIDLFLKWFPSDCHPFFSTSILVSFSHTTAHQIPTTSNQIIHLPCDLLCSSDRRASRHWMLRCSFVLHFIERIFFWHILFYCVLFFYIFLVQIYTRYCTAMGEHKVFEFFIVNI